MILKISKSLTTALLLAVSFNNSYSANNIDINNIIAEFRAGNHSQGHKGSNY